MKVNQSAISTQVNKVLSTNIGNLYFFNNLVISEFNEGVHASFENCSEVISSIIEHFGKSKPFGFITNMINSYSSEPLDTPKFPETMRNMAAYGAVCYSKEAKMSIIIENGFCNNKIICYKDLYEATDSVHNKIKQISIPIN